MRMHIAGVSCIGNRGTLKILRGGRWNPSKGVGTRFEGSPLLPLKIKGRIKHFQEKTAWGMSCLYRFFHSFGFGLDPLLGLTPWAHPPKRGTPHEGLVLKNLKKEDPPMND